MVLGLLRLFEGALLVLGPPELLRFLWLLAISLQELMELELLHALPLR